MLIGLNASAAFTTSLTVVPGTMTNLLSLNNGSAVISSVTAQASVTTNALFSLVDTPTNSLVYVNPAYTNKLRYATNMIYGPLTNYYGVTNMLTNIALITVSNVVAANTNNYNIFGFSAAANSTVTYDQNLYFNHGAWVTNYGGGNVIVTITYIQ
jgi:hypothetical protein